METPKLITGDGAWAYTWQNGRQLQQMSKTGTTASFVYNAEGLRVRKTVNNVVTNYTLHGKNIVHMTQGSNTLHFWYDAQSRPAIVQFNGTKYAYIHNLQGDIVGLIDSSGTEVVKYIYDPWGKILSTTGSLASTLGTVQPFRYRGYIYDVETGLYYLRARYYNPTWNRFLNADAIIIDNLFSYCRNQVIRMIDPCGLDSYDANLWREDSYVVIEVYFHESVPAEAIYFLSDPLAFDYINRYYIKRELDRNGNPLPGKIDCSHYLYEISGQTGSYTARYRYSDAVNCIKKGELRDEEGNLCIELCVGMEVFRFNEDLGYYSHCGKIVLHDFGDGLEFAVTESCSKYVDPEKKKALYYNDKGPNITSFFNLDGTFDWDAFVLFGEE